ncbi:GNAT family N-acetyltransferase [Catenuloplanes japonicus]|uniref:GNAT family N-acetyltransferase n=1 Tax=Catenuloplanes japonicus TaxID=33876 RepID=UPI000525972F|nr:GNAT family N-acetyltransferase [Catenuloplanes japonicus]
MSRADLVSVWSRGWARARGIRAVENIPGGFRFDVGRPGHRVRYVLHTWEPAYLREIGRHIVTPGTWLKIDGSADDLRAALGSQWRMFETHYLMSAPLSAGPAAVPRSYRVEVEADQSRVVTATVVDRTGAVAASGRLAPAGGFGVLDQVETDPEHRRLGLGTAVVQALSDHAARRGVRFGILAATDDGHALYRALGWTAHTELASAFIPES